MTKKMTNRRALCENNKHFVKREYPEVNAVIFISKKLGFALTVLGFSGKRKKEDFYYLFENERDMEHCISSYIDRLKKTKMKR